MKKSIFSFFILASILTACAPQVTVTSEVTVTLTPLSTETPILTPTLHPQFVELQDQIAASGGRFSLQADGTILDGTEPIPGLTVTLDGTITLTVNGEAIVLDPADVNFDDENGISINGYELTEDGNWMEVVIPKEMKEIPLCNSMYDVLTPQNKLNPEHLIDSADLQKVANWVQTQLTKDMFDPAKIKPLSEVGMDTVFLSNIKLLVPETETAPNYEAEQTSPFLKDNKWCGTTVIEEQPYLVVNVPYYIEGKPPEEWPVITGLSPFQVGMSGLWPSTIEDFINRMNVLPWYINEDSIKLAMQYTDPVTGKNFTRERVDEIINEMKQGNFKNTHGLVLQFVVGDNSGGWFE